MKKFRYRTWLGSLLLSALLIPSSGFASQEQNLDRVLEQLKTTAAQISSLQGSFLQEKNLQMFDQLLLSEGALVFVRPDQLRWELLTPVASGFVLQGGQGVRWNAVSREVQRFSVTADPIMGVVARQLLAWAAVDLVWLEQRYRMELIDAELPVLRLLPLDPGEAEFVAWLQVAFDPAAGYVTEVLIMEQSGDSTRLRFNAVRLNDQVREGAFSPPEF